MVRIRLEHHLSVEHLCSGNLISELAGALEVDFSAKLILIFIAFPTWGCKTYVLQESVDSLYSCFSNDNH